MAPTRNYGVGRSSILLASASIVTLVTIAAFSGARVSSAAAINVMPSADAYVSSAATSTNYGTAAQLRIDGSPVVRSYLAFDLRSVTGVVASATLHVYASSAAPMGYEVHATAGGWTETGITFASAPAVGALVAKTGAFSAGTLTSVDVTSAVSTGGLVYFARACIGASSRRHRKGLSSASRPASKFDHAHAAWSCCRHQVGRTSATPVAVRLLLRAGPLNRLLNGR